MMAAKCIRPFSFHILPIASQIVVYVKGDLPHT